MPKSLVEKLRLVAPAHESVRHVRQWANSNLRPAVARAFGFDPFERVVDYLVAQIGR